MRELLNHLVSEGLVVAEGQRGFEVAPVSAQNMRELGELRLLLETHALAQSFKSGGMDWEGRVVSAHHKLATTERRQQAGGPGDNETWKRYDFEFHHALISACGSDTLLEAHAPVFDKYLRYLMIAGIYRGEITAREHQTLLECALKRDARTAVAVLKVHIEACVDFTLASGTYDFSTIPDTYAQAPSQFRRGSAPISASVKVFGCGPTQVVPCAAGPACENLRRRKPLVGSVCPDQQVGRIYAVRARYAFEDFR